MNLIALRRTARLLAVRDHEDFHKVYKRLWQRWHKGKAWDLSAPHRGLWEDRPIRSLAEQRRARTAKAIRYMRKVRAEQRKALEDVRKMLLGRLADQWGKL